MTKKKIFLLSFFSGILFFLSWPPYGFPFLLFVAFVPLLKIEEFFSSEKIFSGKFLLFTFFFLTFFVWNVSTTWWIWHASPGGAIMAILANSFFMAAVFWLFHLAKCRLITASGSRHLSGPITNWLFVIFWLAFEFFHHRWELTWPWLTLGNAFASFHKTVQWYEYTGTLGGSLWALALNVLLFRWLQNMDSKKQIAGIALLIVLPLAVSLGIYYSHKEKGEPANIVVVQPNIDPYSEKFSGMHDEEQLEKMFSLVLQKIDSTTDYLIFPETALTENIWENQLEQTGSVQYIRNFLIPFPSLKIIIGASTRKAYLNDEKVSSTARKFKEQKGYYDAFNTALQLDGSGNIQLYHKSKLVPGVERMPYPDLFGFLESLAIDLGGTSGTLGTQEERTVFHPSSTFPGEGGVAPVICYESIFGEYVGEYIRNGAAMIFIITNDGWWKDSPGYKQHLLYGRLRAIEMRKSIARSANTGISCFINQRGDILQPTEWWKEAVSSGIIYSNTKKTFYLHFGDFIGRICLYTSGIILLYVLALGIFRKRNQ